MPREKGKTRAAAFKELFPNAVCYNSMTDCILPCHIDKEYKNSGNAVRCQKNKNLFGCFQCAKEYWNAPAEVE